MPRPKRPGGSYRCQTFKPYCTCSITLAVSVTPFIVTETVAFDTPIGVPGLEVSVEPLPPPPHPDTARKTASRANAKAAP